MPTGSVSTGAASSIKFAAITTPGGDVAKKLEAAAKAAGVQWLGAHEDFDGFSDAELASIEVLAGHKLNGAKLGKAWSKLTSLKWFQVWSAGVEGIFGKGGPCPCPELPKSSVIMCNASGAYTDIIAEYVMAGVLFFDKELPRREASRKIGKWEKFPLPCCTGEQTFGVVGIGDIGSASAKLAKAFGMRVVATRRRPEIPDPYVDQMYPMDQLKTMLAECDFVCMATPWTPATDKMLKAEHFAAMKKTAVFINVGRGKCVDEAALLTALETDQIKGAALDVTASEPVEEGWRGWGTGMDGKMLMSCHSCDHTEDMSMRSADYFIANLNRYVAGEPLHHVVDKARGY